MTTARARHRATARPLHWASRSVVATAAVPVGALAGCVAAAASSSQPMLGLAGMTVAAVPLALHAWHTRRAERAARPLVGRHALTAAGIGEFFSTLSPSGELSTSAPLDRSWGLPEGIPSPRVAAEASWAAREARAERRAAASIDLSRHEALDAEVDVDVASGAADLDLAVWPTRAERDAEIAELRRVWDAALPLSSSSQPSPVTATGIA